MDSIRASIHSAQLQSETLEEHVYEMKQLVDGAASRHAEWERRLASMVESDTRRSAEVAQKQETIAAALGIRPRAISSPVWRVVQHLLFFVGLIFSVLFVSPLLALRRLNEKRGSRQGSRLSAVARPGRRGQLNGNCASSSGSQVETQNHSDNDRIASADVESIEPPRALSQASDASTSRARTGSLAGRGRASNRESRLVPQDSGDPVTVVTTMPSATHRPLMSENRVEANIMGSADSSDSHSAQPTPRGTEVVGTPRRRLSWANRSSLLGISVEYKSDDSAETDFWNTFDS